MSRVLGVTAAGYHAWKMRPMSARAIEEEHLKERIASPIESDTRHDLLGIDQLRRREGYAFDDILT